MDPTGLPTDNIYKFIALGGLAFAGFMFWLVAKYLYRNRARLDEHYAKAVKLDAEAARAQEALREVRTEVESARKRRPKHKTELQYEPSLTALENKVSEIAGEVQPLVKAKIELEAEILAFRRAIRRFKGDAIFGMFLALSGVFFSLIGFRLWYQRLQKPTDDKFLLSTEVEILELQKKKAELLQSAVKIPAAQPVAPAKP